MVTRLTPKQFKFVKEYAQHHDGSRAYRAAYDCKNWLDSSIAVEACKLLADPKIIQRVESEEAELAALASFTPAAALMAFLDIATADPRELIELRVGCCRHCYGADGQYQWDEPSYMETLRKVEAMDPRDQVMPDVTGGFGYDPRVEPNEVCVKCSGIGVQRVVPKDTSKLSRQGLLLYGGVKQTRNGIEIIMADRTKALENAARIIGAFKDNVRLDGSIVDMLGIMAMTDATEAATAYQQLMRRSSVNKPNGAGATAH